ncbi:MAG: putative toxin-antitoxin system toxin component, PIN family, partial [Nanoarchaeota archaeon]
MRKSRKPALVKVVLDTSSYVSALLSPHGVSASVFELVTQGMVLNFYTEEIFKEVKTVIARQKFNLPDQKQKQFADLIQESSYQLQALEMFQIKKCRDQNDDKFLSLAQQADADFIVSWDDDLLILEK